MSKIKSKLTTKIMLAMSVLFIISFSVMGAISYIQMGNVLHNQMVTLTQSKMNEIESQFAQNQKVYDLIKEKYNSDLLAKANAVAEVINANPAVELATDKLVALAKELDVTEIHVTDENGILKYGNIPDFFGYDFKSADQTKPFMDIIGNKIPFLVQEPTERGVDKTLFQYAGVARLDVPGIVQVGVAPQILEQLLKESDIDALVKKTQFGQSGYLAVADDKGLILSHPQESFKGKNLSDFNIDKYIIGRDSGTAEYKFNGEAKYMQFKKINGNYFIFTISEKEFVGKLNILLESILLTAVLSFIMVIIIIYLVMNQIVIKRVKEINSVIDCLAKGDFKVSTNIKTQDEMGLLGNSLNIAINNVAGLIKGVQRNAENVSIFSHNLAKSTTEASISINEVAKAIEGLATGATEQAKQAQNGTEKLAGLANEINVAVDGSELLESYSNETDSVTKRSIEVVLELKNRFQENKAIVGKVGESVRTLADKSSLITNILSTIEGVAEQTNMLALNAAIEAARAGEQGRGFAVVADEIRKLAEETSRSTKEIGMTVNEIQREIDQAKVNMEKAGVIVNKANSGFEETAKAFDTISGAVAKTINQIENLSGNMKAIETNKDATVISIQEISAIAEESAASTQEIAASIEEQSTSIDEISETSNKLMAIAKDLEISVSQFKV